MRLLIACDKFKGTLTASEANAAIARAFADQTIVLQAIADGGEGTAALLGRALGASQHSSEVAGPLGQSLTAEFWIVPAPPTAAQRLQIATGTSLALADMSTASGLQHLDPAALDPWRASTSGTGELVMAIAAAGARHLVLGLGGSATNDGGAGFATALGYRFLNAAQQAIPEIPANLLQAQTLQAPAQPVTLPAITVACDVENPLLGDAGAIAVFGPQKGVKPSEQPRFNQRLEHLANLVTAALGQDHRHTPGAGAAGGLGFGLLSFAKATLAPGFELVADLLQLEDAIAAADVVITGEGSLDAQSLLGKGPVALAKLARQQGKRVIGLCGRTDDDPQLREWFDELIPLVSGSEPPPSDSATALTRLARAQQQRVLGR